MHLVTAQRCAVSMVVFRPESWHIAGESLQSTDENMRLGGDLKSSVLVAASRRLSREHLAPAVGCGRKT
jgi:hypothetical protein